MGYQDLKNFQSKTAARNEQHSRRPQKIVHVAAVRKKRVYEKRRKCQVLNKYSQLINLRSIFGITKRRVMGGFLVFIGH